MGRLPAAIPLETTSCGGIFEVADISLCSGLQVCSPPRSSLPLRMLPQGSRGFYVRAERGSLPPRASDMLTARRQAIGGTGTCTPLDCGLVGYSFPRSPLSFRTVSFPQYGWKAGFPNGAFLGDRRLKPAPGIRRPPSSLHPPFVHLVVATVDRSESGLRTRSCTAMRWNTPPTPGALAQVRVVLSRSVITYSAPSAPLAGTSRFHRMAAYTRCLRCAGAPRRPTSGSGLSLLIPSWHAVLSDPGDSDIDMFQNFDADMAFAD